MGVIPILAKLHTVDREIFTLKRIRVKIFRVDKFSRFRSIREILTVNGYNIYGRAPGEFRAFGLLPGNRRAMYPLAVVVERTFISGGVEFTRTLTHCSSPRKFYFRVLHFRGWSRPRNYFNSEIFPIYGTSDIVHVYYTLPTLLFFNLRSSLKQRKPGNKHNFRHVPINPSNFTLIKLCTEEIIMIKSDRWHCLVSTAGGLLR